MALLVLPEPAPPVALPMPPLTFLACADVNFFAPRSFVFFVVFPFFATMALHLSGLIEPFALRGDSLATASRFVTGFRQSKDHSIDEKRSQALPGEEFRSPLSRFDAMPHRFE
jgi:hypothetical protein